MIMRLCKGYSWPLNCGNIVMFREHDLVVTSYHYGYLHCTKSQGLFYVKLHLLCDEVHSYMQGNYATYIGLPNFNSKS